MTLMDARLSAARIRAALAFTGIEVKHSQKEIGIHPSTMARIVSPTKPRTVKPDEMQLIADACPDVPRWFLEHGWEGAGVSADDELTQQVQQLRTEMNAVLRIMRVRIAGLAGTTSLGSQAQVDPSDLGDAPGTDRPDQ